MNSLRKVNVEIVEQNFEKHWSSSQVTRWIFPQPTQI